MEQLAIDHIGYTVKRMDRSMRGFETLGYNFEPRTDDTDRNAQLAFDENLC